MTPAALAALHARVFTTPRPWSTEEFSELLADPTCFLVTTGPAFALGRVVLDEAELLTIATDPDHRRQGHGARCLAAWDDAATARAATRAFLEVAADNTGARALYLALGWRETGLRRGYYRTPEGGRIDAQIMGKTLG